MASRCLAVGGKNSGVVPWVLNYGKAGLLVDAESPDEMVKDIVKVLCGRNRYMEYVEQGIEHIKSNFTLDIALEKYNSMCEKYIIH